MNISYYEYGNLKSKDNYGLGIIYDENGKLILRNEEQFLFLNDSMRSEISTRWDWKAELIFADYGVGTLYRTNFRLVFIREPSSLSHLRDLEPVPDVGHMLWAKNWKNRMFKECWEVPLEEIVGIWKKKRWKKAFLIIFSKIKIFGTNRLSIFFPKHYFREEFIGDLYLQRSVNGFKEVIKKYGKE